MSKKEQVTEFIRKVFELYDADTYEVFYNCDPDTGKEYQIPLFHGKDIDDQTLSKVSIRLGLTPDEILAMDFDAAKRYWNKYNFFRLFKEFKSEWYWQFEYKEKPSQEEILIKAIFGDKAKIDLSKRYDYEFVKRRMIQQLHDIDAVMPGTYHTDAKITNLQIETEVFVSFPECAAMIHSFLDIVETVKSLFFKGLRSDLSQDEINEYNFLVSWFHITDIVAPSIYLTYDNILTYRAVYLEEGYSDFFSYARIRSFIGTSPWRCKEFYDDLTLVQRFVNVFPESRNKMREFSLEVSKFSCYFTWSDAKPITFSTEEEQELNDFLSAIGEERLPLEKRAKEPTHVYVTKTVEEMEDWALYAKKLSRISASSSRGGIVPAKPEIDESTRHSVQRIMKRVEARRGGN